MSATPATRILGVSEKGKRAKMERALGGEDGSADEAGVGIGMKKRGRIGQEARNHGLD